MNIQLKESTITGQFQSKSIKKSSKNLYYASSKNVYYALNYKSIYKISFIILNK